MNRKNTILIAVMINAGLLTVLLVAALTTQESTLPANNELAENELSNPKFDDSLLYQDLPQVVDIEAEKKQEPAQELIHQLPTLVAESEAVSLPSPTENLTPIAKAKPLPITRRTNEIVVKKGDNLERLARKHQTSVDEIIKLNRLPSSFLKIGQVLKIPASHSLANKVRKPKDLGPEYYTIKVGENPWAIAIRYHMKLDELLRLNGLNEEKARRLRPGNRLRIR